MPSTANIPPLLLPLIAINLFGHIALSGGRVTTSLYALEAGSPEVLVGVLIGLYGFLPMILSLTVGRWIDHRGPFIPMRIGMVSVIVGISLPVFIPHVATLFATAVLCGTGFMMVSLSAQYSVSHLDREPTANRVAHFGWLALGHSASGVLGPTIVGITIDHIGYKAAFAVLVASAGIALLIIVMHRSGLATLRAQHQHTAHRNIRTLVADPSIRRIYIVGVLVAIAWDLFTFLMPILGHRQQFSASTIGAILSAFAAGSFVIRLVTSRLSMRFTEWQILRAAIVVIVMVYVAFPLTTSAPLLFALSFTLGAAVGCGQPNVLSLLHATTPPGRGAEAVGFRSMLNNASTVVVPLIFGATAASLGLFPIFWSMAALVAMALPVTHRAMRG